MDFEARDQYSAIEKAANDVKRLLARFRVGARQRLEFSSELYIKGFPGPMLYDLPPRRVEVHALGRTNAVFDLNLSRELNSVLELLEPLALGTPAAAVAGSWAAIEALFIGPGDTANRVVAATRMARIVACAYARSEFLYLANAYAATANDALASQIQNIPDATARAALLENTIRAGVAINYKRTRHDSALTRMRQLIANPDTVLPRVVGQLEDAFRRLYRQRNLIVHAGDLTSIALAGTLRTLAPLIGAGIDTVVNASAITGASPLELAAMAEIRLASVADRQRQLVDLL